MKKQDHAAINDIFCLLRRSVISDVGVSGEARCHTCSEYYISPGAAIIARATHHRKYHPCFEAGLRRSHAGRVLDVEVVRNTHGWRYYVVLRDGCVCLCVCALLRGRERRRWSRLEEISAGQKNLRWDNIIGGSRCEGWCCCVRCGGRFDPSSVDKQNSLLSFEIVLPVGRLFGRIQGRCGIRINNTTCVMLRMWFCITCCEAVSVVQDL